METGNTAWKNRLPDIGKPDVNGGIDNTYFTSGSDYDIEDSDRIYTGSLLSADVEQLFLIPDYTFLPKMVDSGRINYITCFKKEGASYMAFSIENPYKEFSPSGWGLTELNLYNLTEKKYVYKKVAINPNRDTRAAVDIAYQAPDLFFQSSKYIHSYNAMTGEENWRTYLGAAPLTSDLLLADNRLFSACEDENYLFCLDATSGSILWKIRNTGTCSPLSYLNGVVYFNGGGDGYLHAVEAATGKLLWKIKSPDESINSNAFFNGSVNAVPGKNGSKGVVVATSGLNAYAYEAIR